MNSIQTGKESHDTIAAKGDYGPQYWFQENKGLRAKSIIQKQFQL